MIMASSKYLFCSISLALCLFSTLFVNPISCQEVKTRLYVFGDARFDGGNFAYQNPTNAIAKHPYGMSIASHKFAYGMGRRSDGLLIPDFLAQFAGLGIIQPSLKVGANMEFGANFAYRGTGARTTNAKNLRQQLQQFTRVAKELVQDIGSAEAMDVLKKSVYLFSIGRTDYLSYSGSAAQPAKIALVNAVIAEIKSVVTDIYNQGGRKFGFLNIEPLGCLPQFKQAKNLGGTQCVAQLSELARLHNSALSTALGDLQTTLPGFIYSLSDVYTATENRLNNPGQYGLKEGFVACCGTGLFRGTGCGINKNELCSNPTERLYFDGQGVSQTGEYQFAKLFWSGGADVTSPYNLQQLFQTNLLQDM